MMLKSDRLRPTEEILQMINDCLKRSSSLSNWQYNFVESLAHQIQKYSISEKQYQILEKIWDKVT